MVNKMDNNVVIGFNISQINNLIVFIEDNLIDWVVQENLSNDETDKLCDICTVLKTLKAIRDDYNKAGE